MARPSKHPAKDIGEAADDNAHIAYADLPPPTAEERAQIIARLVGRYDEINQRLTETRRAKLLSWADFAPK